MPTKPLPASPDLLHLKSEARSLRSAYQKGEREAAQLVVEFHPKQPRPESFNLAAAQFTIARQYGFASWARLKRHVEAQAPADLSYRDRIEDPLFLKALDLLDAGDADGLRTLLADHPWVARHQVSFEGGNYFRNPSLLEFVAENPVRNGKLPTNIVELAKVILDAGPPPAQARLDEALGLVSSGRVPRECGVQRPLIHLLCQSGANPDAAMLAALGHGEFDAVHALLAQGAKRTITVAAALGDEKASRELLSSAHAEERHLALSLSCQFGHARVAELLLKSGEDPNRYNPVGAHAHSTPLHQATLAGHLETVRVLIEHGADTTIRDLMWKGTPLGWAEHGGQREVAEYLRSQAPA